MSHARPNNSYTVEQYNHGIVIRGDLSVDDLSALAELAKKRGFVYIDAGIGSALGGAWVLVSEESGNLWRAEIEAENLRRYPDDPELRWLKGCDTGTSALTILSVLSKKYAGNLVFQLAGSGRLTPGTPHDSGDFGRCYRLLELFPEWRARLGEIAKKYPEWIGLASQWNELEKVYAEELPSGQFPKFSEALKDASRIQDSNQEA